MFFGGGRHRGLFLGVFLTELSNGQTRTACFLIRFDVGIHREYEAIKRLAAAVEFIRGHSNSTNAFVRPGESR